MRMRHWFGFILVLGLVGCAALGLSTPKGFDQQLASAYGVHSAIVQATTTALSSGAITSTEAQAVQAQALTSRALLDTAKAAETAGNTAGASNNLSLALAGLTALQNYLNSQSKAKGVK
jgi:hypothetical protein